MDYKRTNWNLFKSYIDNRITININSYNSKAAIDNEIGKLTKLILDSRDLSTPKINKSHVFNLDPSAVKFIKIRRSMKKKIDRAISLQEKLLYERYIKLLSKSIDKHINTERNEKWTKLLSDMKAGDKKFWKISRSLRGKGKIKIPCLNVGAVKINSDYEKAQLLANTFVAANNLSTHFSHSQDRYVNAKVNNILYQPPTTEGARFTTISEISNCIATLKISKSPGLDQISNLLIKNLPHKALQLLVLIFNSCIKPNYFPNVFKTAKIIPIHKAGKPKNNPNSYRPSYSLLSNIGKIFEKIINIRLNDFASDNQIISCTQFGFKKQHSTVHQVCRLKNKVLTNKMRKRMIPYGIKDWFIN